MLITPDTLLVDLLVRYSRTAVLDLVAVRVLDLAAHGYRTTGTVLQLYRYSCVRVAVQWYCSSTGMRYYDTRSRSDTAASF